MNKKYAGFVRKALGLGAVKAKIIPVSSVTVSGWVRMKCRYGCDMFGVRLTCPPNSPRPEETENVLAGYKHALFFSAPACREIRRIAPLVEKEFFLDGFYKAFALAAGPCGLCPSCAKTCRHPETARPAMEACGIDVFATARRNGFKLEVLKNKSTKPDCYGLVLID